MTLREWIEKSGIRPVATFGETAVSGFADDSRSVQPGDAFASMPSVSRPVEPFLADAAKLGATLAVVPTAELSAYAQSLGLAVLQLRYDPGILTPTWAERQSFGFFEDLAELGKALFDDPSRSMQVIGVTGTNGKTTVCWFLRQALGGAYLGTLGYLGAGTLEETGNTTLFPVSLWRTLARARAEGMRSLVMEVSSHALAQRRCHGVGFDAGVFTNLTQDHLDYHGSMGQYAAAKRGLFDHFGRQSPKAFAGVINSLDPVGREWVADGLGTAFGDELKVVELTPSSTILAWRGTPFEVPIAGAFNVENLRAVFATLLALGWTESRAMEALVALEPAPGRFESFTGPSGVSAVVDYAHTPDALEKLLESVRTLRPRRIISVFGCGGDRDRTKRPRMAAISCRLADHTLLTLDNPRTEEPDQIFADLAQGCSGSWAEIRDRREAINVAVGEAQPGDVVVVSGKGHEDYLIIGHTKHPFDDRAEVRKALGQ